MDLQALRTQARARAASMARAAAAAAPSMALNGAGLAGAGLIAYGAHEVYHPAGWLVLGSELLLGVFLVLSAQRAAAPAKAD